MTISTLTATIYETGYLRKEGSVWATVWGHAGIGGYEGLAYYEAHCYVASSDYYLSRGRIRFDTSGCSGTVVSATLKIGFFRVVDINTYGTNYLHFVRAVGCGDNMATSDFGSLKDNTEDICENRFLTPFIDK